MTYKDQLSLKSYLWLYYFGSLPNKYDIANVISDIFKTNERGNQNLYFIRLVSHILVDQDWKRMMDLIIFLVYCNKGRRAQRSKA